MARRRKKKNNSRKIWFVLILLCAVSLLGWKIWTSDEVQMRFVYMWPYQGEILEYSGKNKIDPFLVAAVIKNESNFDRKAVSKVGAYNAGLGNTKAWMQENNWGYDFNRIEDIPYSDTREYVRKVLYDRDEYYKLYKNRLKKY